MDSIQQFFNKLVKWSFLVEQRGKIAFIHDSYVYNWKFCYFYCFPDIYSNSISHKTQNFEFKFRPTEFFNPHVFSTLGKKRLSFFEKKNKKKSMLTIPRKFMFCWFVCHKWQIKRHLLIKLHWVNVIFFNKNPCLNKRLFLNRSGH